MDLVEKFSNFPTDAAYPIPFLWGPRIWVTAGSEG